MRFVMALVIAIFMLPMVACKKVKHQESTIVKDCTGTYLRLNGKDYHVCNKDMIAQYPDGTKITATFKTINTCKASENETICMMYHENEGWVEVIRAVK
ncbi:MAG: hypothetical protein EOP56_14445 [Sphingobacteriales bacterium]|nr:MAG: hypothetical protein EOP56_14445 [Sphingobacteriales bacterium]